MARYILCVQLLALFWSSTAVYGLKVTGLNHEFVNWTHVADFVFQPQGELVGEVSSSNPDTWLLVFDDNTWLKLRASFDPIISTCHLKSLAAYSANLGPNPQVIRYVPTEMSKHHVYIADVPSSCSKKVLILQQWRNIGRRGPIKILHRLFSNQFNQLIQKRTVQHDKSSDVEEAHPQPTLTSFNLHFTNPQFGMFKEFSSEELMVFPAITVFCLVYLLLIRFQLASVRLLWANTGIAIASALLVIFFFKFVSLLFNWLGLLVFVQHGVEAQNGSHNYKWGSLLLDGMYGLGTLALLIALSKGWMITTPSLFADDWTKLQFATLVINAFASVTSLAKYVMPITEKHSTVISDLVVGSSHLLVFLTSYADLVNLARVSRHHVGAKPRARAFNVVAVLLLLWAITPVIQAASSHLLVYWLEPMFITMFTLSLQAFSSILMAWAFRPELLWELHGERPHAGVGFLLSLGNNDTKSLKRFDDSADELDGLLQV